MHSGLFQAAAALADGQLHRRVVALAGQERTATVELVAHLAELDARRLYLAEGYGSLFVYCTDALLLAEHAAYNRIEAARLSRRFPALLDLLASGTFNLSTLRLLGPHLHPDNFESLAVRTGGKSKREVEVIVAGLAPKPDVTPTVRKLPARGQSAVAPATGPNLPLPAAEPAGPMTAQMPATWEPPSPRPLVKASAPERYRVQFTVGATTHQKLRQVQDLLRREIPDGDPGAIFDRALTLLPKDVSRRKLGLASKVGHTTRRGPEPRSTRRRGIESRHLPAEVKRVVWLRDGGRCAFVATNGRRCSAGAYLELHHRHPYTLGGQATVDNLSLRCRGHNQHEGELVFGSRTRRANSPRDEFGLREPGPIGPT